MIIVLKYQIVRVLNSTWILLIHVVLCQWRIQGGDEGDASPLPAYINFLHVKKYRL